MAPAREDLTCEGRVEGRVGLLRLSGEVRAELVGRVHEAVAGLQAAGARDLLIGLRDVAFVDSASIGEFLRLDAAVSAAGGRVLFHSLPRIARRVLDVTGLRARLHVADDEVAARALLAPP